MRLVLVLATTLAAMAGHVTVANAITLPPGFSDEHVTTVASPTALAFTPDGRMLVATQPGSLRVHTAAGGLLAAPALNLNARTCGNRDRGLLGVAVDPAFATNRFIYVFYTFNKFANGCPTNAAQTPVNRVSRFVLPASNVVDPATELVLIDNIPSYAGDHNGGDLQFGKDGNLYVSVGDGGCDYAGGGCAALNDASRDEHVLLGKILRITPAGAIPADNPHAQDPAAARCNVTGRTDVLTRCRETFARGLRNPFRIAFDPNAAATRFYINDVGQNVWEEIDLGIAGADYGWNAREGHCATGSTTNCGPPPPGMTNPAFDYGHGDGCASITGGAFVPAAAWPAPYAGTYLFGDYVCGRIFQLVPNGSGGLTRLVFADGLGASSAVHLAFGPGGALYYTNYAGGGAVRRIVRVIGNRAPTADVRATPSSGPAPLNVSFDGSGSSDPDAGDTLKYVWDFGDGSPVAETTAATTSHTYGAPGTYTASLRVRDNHGALSAADTQRIDAGNTPPLPVIGSPTAGQSFAVGETILLRGSASDEQDGTLPPTSLSWTVLRHHAAHTHPYLGPVTGNGASFDGPAPEDLPATTNSFIEVRLTATDSKGATTTVTRTVAPKLVDLSFATQPSGLLLTLEGTAFTAPRTWPSWEGWALTASAPDQGAHAFASWSDGGARTHVIHTPAGGAAYTATFAAAADTIVNDAVIGTAPGTFAYAGTWATSAGPGKYLGDDHYSATAGSSYTFRFVGTHVALYGATASHHGRATVQVDDLAPVTIDAYSAARQEDALLFASPQLAPGEHAVTVTVTGTHQVASSGDVVAVDRAAYGTRVIPPLVEPDVTPPAGDPGAAVPPPPPAPAPAPATVTGQSDISPPATATCRPPRATRSLRVRIQRGNATRKVVAGARARLGSRARTSYAVKLTRDCKVVGTGVARGTKLMLTLRSSGTKTVTRSGRRVQVKRYPRLSGRYLLQPAGGGPRLPVTRVSF